MVHYRKLNVDNFETMRLELEAATFDKVNANTRFWGEEYSWFKNNSYNDLKEMHHKKELINDTL